MDIVVNRILFNRSLVDGPGIRSLIFLQGCNLHCKGCQNKATWDINKGKSMPVKELAHLIKGGSFNKKITITGGEPLLQKESVIELIKMLPGFDIALYTGHEKSDVPEEILSKIKYLKTGPFMEELKTSIIPYVGSSNQKFERIGE